MNTMALSQVRNADPSSALDNMTTQMAGQSELGKEDFLKLLVVQMENQDPLEPMDNKDLILQLSQFSTLEGTQNLNENLTKMLGTSNITSASSMIGKQITYHDESQGFAPTTGIVDHVNIKDNEVTLSVNGKELELSQVVSIGVPEAPASDTE